MKHIESKFCKVPGLCLALIMLCLLFSACKKDSFITSQNAALTTSVDSVKFDTIFTSTGSVTQSFKINNPNNQKLLLNKVKLIEGDTSSFKININGQPATEATNIEIAANDSIYVFVTVKINPNATNQPFVVKDSILIMYNGNNHFVKLQAYGQNAIFFNNQIITGNTTWGNKLPYVISGSLHIVAGASLTISAGCKIYSHADAPFIVNGTLVINGEKQAPVVFNGDRLDDNYKDLPASWPGIYFTGTSKNNVLTYAVVKNAYQAVVAEKPSVNTNPKLLLHQCIIDNAYDAGLLCVNSSVAADNSLITNCGTNISLTYGGNYSLTNCTVAAYSNIYGSHKKPVLVVNNYVSDGTNLLIASLGATFTNCIFWGDDGLVDNQVTVDKQGANPFSVAFSNCLYKAKDDPLNSTITDCIKNIDPLFTTIDVTKRLYDFRISDKQSATVNSGINTNFTTDLDGNNRKVGTTDIGCYEQQ